jgi:hypothetical protein
MQASTPQCIVRSVKVIQLLCSQYDVRFFMAWCSGKGVNFTFYLYQQNLILFYTAFISFKNLLRMLSLNGNRLRSESTHENVTQFNALVSSV